MIQIGKSTFKTGVIGDEVGPEVTSWIEWAEAQNPRPDGVEIRTANGKPAHKLEYHEANAMRESLTQAGLEIFCLTGPFGKANITNANGEYDEEVATSQLRLLEKQVIVAQMLGVSRIRAFTGWHYRDSTVYWPNVLCLFHAALQILPRDFVLVVENEAATGCSTLCDVNALANELADGCSRIKGLWDAGNYVYDRTVCEALRMASRNVNHLLQTDIGLYYGQIQLVHFKNCAKSAESTMVAQTTRANEGEVDYPSLLETMVKLDRDWTIDLEPHRTATGAQLAEATRAFPGGEGYGSPEACTEDWRILHGYLRELEERFPPPSQTEPLMTVIHAGGHRIKTGVGDDGE